MQREIKFRAWDKEFEIMITDDPIEPDNKTLFMIGLNNEIAIFRKKIGDSYKKYDYEFHDSFILQKQNRYILMQYTGLKDKNGKMIFEGDVVRQKPLMCDEEKVGVVSISPTQGVKFGIYPYFTTPCEIIGNLYENPDLTKEVQ